MSDNTVLSLEAKRREKQNGDKPSCRPLSPDYEFVGLAGEAEFSKVFDLPMDLNPRPGGDNHTDFVLALGFKVNVKASRKAFNLPEQEGRVKADIYVLAEYSDDEAHARLIGWEWGHVLVKAPLKDLNNDGVLYHCIHRDKLRKIGGLKDRQVRLQWAR